MFYNLLSRTEHKRTNDAKQNTQQEKRRKKRKIKNLYFDLNVILREFAKNS